MEEELLRLLAAKGVTLTPDGRMVRLAGFTGTDPLTDEQIRYINDRRGDHDIEARQQFNWVASLAQVVRELELRGVDAEWPYFSVFWTRLHGLIAEMRGEWVDGLRAAGIDPSTHVPPRGSLAGRRIELLTAADAVVAVLSEDERIYADYRRQTEGHPTQESYAVRWSRKAGTVVDRRAIATVGREFTVTELDAAVRRVLAAYRTADGRPNEDAIAVALARKVRAPLGAVLAIMRRDFVPL